MSSTLVADGTVLSGRRGGQVGTFGESGVGESTRDVVADGSDVGPRSSGDGYPLDMGPSPLGPSTDGSLTVPRDEVTNPAEAAQVDEQRGCPNGHPVSGDGNYCATCGAAIRSTDHETSAAVAAIPRTVWYAVAALAVVAAILGAVLLARRSNDTPPVAAATTTAATAPPTTMSAEEIAFGDCKNDLMNAFFNAPTIESRQWPRYFTDRWGSRNPKTIAMLRAMAFHEGDRINDGLQAANDRMIEQRIPAMCQQIAAGRELIEVPEDPMSATTAARRTSTSTSPTTTRVPSTEIVGPIESDETSARVSQWADATEYFSNFTYPADVCPSTTSPIRVTDGARPLDYAKGDDGVGVAAKVLGFDDFDGDGRNEAAILIACSGGAMASRTSVAVYRPGDPPQRVALIPSRDRIQINGIRKDGEDMVLDARVWAPGDGGCCPSQTAQIRYRWTGSGFEPR